jgi:hypothetical protein
VQGSAAVPARDRSGAGVSVDVSLLRAVGVVAEGLSGCAEEGGVGAVASGGRMAPGSGRGRASFSGASWRGGLRSDGTGRGPILSRALLWSHWTAPGDDVPDSRPDPERMGNARPAGTQSIVPDYEADFLDGVDGFEAWSYSDDHEGGEGQPKRHRSARARISG